MSGVFSCPADITARYLDSAVTDYLSRMNTHHENQRALADRATVTTETGPVTCWQSAGELRLWAHENELAELAQQSMYECARYRSRAMFRAYAHSCLCRVRVVRPRPVVFTLAQVAHLFAGTDRERATSAPPGQLRTRTVLATCHASNAPGLSAHSQRMETGRT